MSNTKKYQQTKSRSFDTLERELSSRIDHPDKNLNIEQKTRGDKFIKPTNRAKTSKPKNNNDKIKFITTDRQDFKDFFLFGNRSGQNYNTEEENELRFSESTRRKSIPKTIMKNFKKISKDPTVETIGDKSEGNVAIMHLLNNDTILKTTVMAIDSNLVCDTAAKAPKATSDYWDNTKRRNLDTSIYTNNPMKIQGRGFGDINTYDMFLNGIGLSTRQDNPDDKPQNLDDDRIFLTNHNYHYDKHHVTEMLPCGTDTRYLNKKII